MNKKFIFSFLSLLLVQSAQAGEISYIGNDRVCVYFVDGVKNTRYCDKNRTPNDGLDCRADGSCSYTPPSSRGTSYKGTIQYIGGGNGGGLHSTQ